MIQGTPPRKVGLVVNPIAGMGGRVALKGTDGRALGEAIARGATPRAPTRAGEFATAVASLRPLLQWFTCAGPMGANVLEAAAVPFHVVSTPRDALTTARDTRSACRAFVEAGVELVVFVGGDGTCLDVFEEVGKEIAILGIPAGVKMHSGVFAVNPQAGAQLVMEFSRGSVRIKEGEVLDADEDALRRGVIEVSLKGVALTLASQVLVQAAKVEYKGEVEEVSKRGIADHLLERMDDDTLYIIGPGSTAGAVMGALGLTHSLLGVDLVLQRRLLRADATDAEIRQALERHGGPAELLVGVIGAQGFVFGRGNLQFSPEVIRAVGKAHISILAAEEKVGALDHLLVDTGDGDLDRELSGHWRVLCGYHWSVFLPMRAPVGPT